MKKLLSLLLTALVLCSCLCCISSAQECSDITTDNMEFAVKTAQIVKNSGEESMLRIIGRLQPGTNGFDFCGITDCVVSQDGRFVMQLSSESELLACLEELNSNPAVIYAERDIPVYTETLQETSEHLSWGVEAIEADIYAKAIAPSVSDRSITVAVVDSGCENIDFLRDRLVDGYDFFENDEDAAEDTSVDSHGTFLAGIIADCTPGLPVKIMPVRVLGSRNGSLINAINGITYAADNGADVINISLGAPLKNCKPLEDAIAYAVQKDAAVVVCSGNTKSDIENFCPAHIADVITVSSVDKDYRFSESFSNFGNEIDLAAPGENIKGYNASGEITAMSGTSMSAAFVSAAAAMFRLDNPACNNSQVHHALVSCAEDLGDEGRDKYYGYGVTKLGGILNSQKKYVESVSLSQKTITLYEGDTLEIMPVFSPADATDKAFTLSADSSIISINGSSIAAVSEGTAVLTVTSNDGCRTDTAEITVKKLPEITAKLKIKNNPGTKTICYGETLRLTAEITDRPVKPEITSIRWYVDGKISGEGEVFEISPAGGSVEITAKLVDAQGNPVINSQGNEVCDFETVTVKDGFFQKIISFFKNLFRMNRTVDQAVTE